MLDGPRLPRHLPALDGLRGIAALLVLAGHWIGSLSAEYGSALYIVKRALWLAGTGVDLFFVLSGFLIGGILLDHRASPNLLRVFWLRRAARILPLYAVFLAVFAVISRWPATPLLHANTQPLWVHAAFLSNLWAAGTGAGDASFLGSTWSLAIEEQVYLALPVIVLLAPIPRLRRGALIVLLLSPIARGLAWMASPVDLSVTAHNLTLCRLDGFAVGLFLAIEARRAQPIWRTLPRERLLLLGAIPALIMFWLTRHNEFSGGLAFCLIGYSAFAFFYGWCLAVALHLPLVTAALSCRPLLWAGRHSYFIYLFQGIVAVAVHRLCLAWLPAAGVPSWLHLGLSALALVGIASLSLRWFEGPLISRARKLPYDPAPA